MNKKVIVKKNDEIVQFAIFHDEQVMNDWIAMLASTEAWGKPYKLINHPEQVNSQEPLVIHHDEVITVNPDLIIHHDEISTPVADLIVHHEEVITPVADLVVNHAEVITPVADLIVHHGAIMNPDETITPEWDEVIPQPPIITPAWDEVIPQDPIVTPAWDEVVPQPPIITPAWDEILVQAITVTPAYDELVPQPDIIIPAWTEEFEAEYTIEIVDITDEMNAKDLQRKYDYLWKAANDYQSGQISGAAIGLLTIGVLAQKPKCTAVQAWIKSVWVEYYTRKAGVNLQNNVNLDFSVCGNIPYTVPELMEEVSI